MDQAKSYLILFFLTVFTGLFSARPVLANSGPERGWAHCLGPGAWGSGVWMWVGPAIMLTIGLLMVVLLVATISKVLQK